MEEIKLQDSDFSLDLPVKDYNYSNYCKPQLAEFLELLGLNQVYVRALGAYMWYHNDYGEEIKIIDFLGGYGSTLLGHNHPYLISKITQAYKNQVPFAAQLSNRSKAGLLGKKLNDLFEQVCGEKYLTLQGNTGAEAIELTIKHAELSKSEKLKKQLAKIEKELCRVREFVDQHGGEISQQFNQLLSKKLNEQNLYPLDDIFQSIKRYNIEVMKKKSRLLALKGAFHGKTCGAVQLTHHYEYREPFNQMGADVCFLEVGNNGQLERHIKESMYSFLLPSISSDKHVVLEERPFTSISAFFIEPLQGEGGIHIIPKEYLQFCREQADHYHFALVFDEIQSGMGRTGTFLFSEQQEVIADYYLLSKSLGGGLAKISTVSFKESLHLPEFDTLHSSTFAEDDMSAMVAMATLELTMQDGNTLSACRKKGDFILCELKKLQIRYPYVLQEIRGSGLMIGVEFSSALTCSNGINELIRQDNLAYVVAGYLLNEHGIRVAPTLSHGTTIRIEPSIMVTALDCSALINGLARTCEILQKKNLFALTKYIIELKSNTSEKIKDYFEPVTTVKEMSQPPVTKVYFIAHLVRASDLKLWDRSFEGFNDQELEYYLEKVYKIFGPSQPSEFIIKSSIDTAVSLNFIGYIIDARLINKHLIKRDRGFIQSQIQEAVNNAINAGASVIGLGGFTSIATNNCRNLLADSTALTSGNSLTVGMGLEAIYKTSKEKGVNLEQSTIAVVGAAGNIASVYAEIIAEQVPRIILIGRNGSEKRLIKVANSIYKNSIVELSDLYHQNNTKKSIQHTKGITAQIAQLQFIQNLFRNRQKVDNCLDDINIYDKVIEELGENAPIKISIEIKAIKNADIILSASNSSKPIIFSDMLKMTGVVICDIAVPQDVDQSVSRYRPDVSVIKGGLVKLPSNPDLSIKGMPLEKGQVYACMAETILLGLMGITSNYSYGSITKSQVKIIMAAADLHGFKLAQIKTEDSY